MYDPKSLKAEEFISHDEIMDTLAYAEKNKHNAELIDQIIEKAKLWKGLDHREASVLLACDLPDRNERIFKLAEQLKKDFYDKKNILRFFISAEHIEQLKTYIDFLEYYQNNSDTESLQEICIEMAGTLENISANTFYIH